MALRFPGTASHAFRQRTRGDPWAGRGAAPAAGENISTLELLRQPRILGFFFTRFITDPFTFFFIFWLPAYLQTAHGLTLATIGAMAWIPYLGSDVGALTGGAISDAG